MRFRKLPVQIPGEIPESSSVVRFPKVPLQIPRSGGFQSRCLVRFRWVLMMMVGEVSEGSRTAAV